MTATTTPAKTCPAEPGTPAGPSHQACAICKQAMTPCPCGIWWCTGWKHLDNREVGGSHFCYLGNCELIAQPAPPPSAARTETRRT